MSLADLLLDSAAEHGERVAVRLGDAELTYQALDVGSQLVAGLLASRGVAQGDRVGIMLPNVPYFPPIYYGVLRAGGVVVPMNPLLKSREVQFHLEDAGAKLLFAWHDFAGDADEGAEAAGAEAISVVPGEFEAMLGEQEARPDVVERADEDTAVILYTSGTTGTPKGAELTHGNLRRNVEVATGILDLSADDVVFGGLPFFHSFGQTCALNATISMGATVSLLPRFDPEQAFEVIQRDGVTILEGVPTMYTALLHHPAGDACDTSSLRLCVSGGSALPGEVLRGFEAKFGAAILEGYGLSETSPVASFNHPDRGAQAAGGRGAGKVGSIGTPVEGVQMKLVDDEGNEVPQGEIGEIAIKGHNVMKGYWQRPDATDEVLRDGWFHTGDMARVDEEGYFFIVDRKKDLIIRGGYNVYPREIEEVLYEHPAVAEAAVIGVPHEELGEEVGAAVTLKEGESVDEDALRRHVKEQVAAYKYPRRIWFVDELPKGPTGKILKREIEPPEEVA